MRGETYSAGLPKFLKCTSSSLAHSRSAGISNAGGGVGWGGAEDSKRNSGRHKKKEKKEKKEEETAEKKRRLSLGKDCSNPSQFLERNWPFCVLFCVYSVFYSVSSLCSILCLFCVYSA